MALDVPTLGDDVIALRPPAERDLDAIVEACQDPEIPRFTRVPSPYRRADAEDYLAKSAEGWSNGTSASFVIVDATDDSLLGSTGLHQLDADRNVTEIGYWVAKAARRRGIATRAVRLVSRWGARKLGIRRIELLTSVENEASQRVADAAGFTREGVLRSYFSHSTGLLDVVMYSLLPADVP
jgi:RimJ/RimL family protein N-acetyltransferase